MKVTWEHFIPVLITVGGGLLLWGIKIAINAIAKSMTQKVNEEMRQLRAEVDALEKQVDTNTRRIDFLIQKLIERNS